MLQGLELHPGPGVLSQAEQAELEAWCESQLLRGRAGALCGKKYMQGTVPRRVVTEGGRVPADRTDKWLQGKGREVLQFGVFYDYAAHRIAPELDVAPMPPELAELTARLSAESVVPAGFGLDSCIGNFYAAGDCIPPHVDHEHYPRPFCAISLVNEAPILFGKPIAVVAPGEFDAPFRLPLPT